VLASLRQWAVEIDRAVWASAGQTGDAAGKVTPSHRGQHASAVGPTLTVTVR
jgi:hypothetical protein